MAIRILSQKPLLVMVPEDPPFHTALDVTFQDACWTHTTLCAAGLLRSLAQLARSDHHKVTVYHDDEVKFTWEGYLGDETSHPNTKVEYEAMCLEIERWG